NRRGGPPPPGPRRPRGPEVAARAVPATGRLPPRRGGGLARRADRARRALVLGQSCQPLDRARLRRAPLLGGRLLLGAAADRDRDRPGAARAADVRLALANLVRPGAALEDRTAGGRARACRGQPCPDEAAPPGRRCIGATAAAASRAGRDRSRRRRA